jgi:hypothetical protein
MKDLMLFFAFYVNSREDSVSRIQKNAPAGALSALPGRRDSDL